MAHAEASTADPTEAPPRLPSDSYTVRIEGVEVQTTEEGEETWRVCMRIVEGRLSGSEYGGVRIYDTWVPSRKEEEKAILLLCLCFGLVGELDDLSPDELVGREGEIEVSWESAEQPVAGDGETIPSPWEE